MNRPSVAQRLLIGLVRGYQLLFSAWLGGQCRFEPTCSAYAVEALRRHGAGAGSLLAAGRLLRCHPWCAGGCDPVPPRPLFRRLVRDADVPAGDPCSSRETTAS